MWAHGWCWWILAWQSLQCFFTTLPPQQSPPSQLQPHTLFSTKIHTHRERVNVCAFLLSLAIQKQLSAWRAHELAQFITPWPAQEKSITIIAVAVALPDWSLACLSSGAALEQAVLTCTDKTMFVIVVLTTAVTSVPSTPSIVVAVVARLVCFPSWLFAWAFGLFDTAIPLSFAVEAQTVYAVLGFTKGPATVSSIPCTSSAVVFIVAETVTFEFRFSTTFLNGFHASITSAHVSAIQALALLTVAVVVFRSATVATVPITTSIVVHVIAVAIAFPSQFLADPLHICSALIARRFVRAI